MMINQYCGEVMRVTKEQIYKAIGFFEAQRDHASHEAAEYFDTMIGLAEQYLADLDTKKAPAALAR